MRWWHVARAVSAVGFAVGCSNAPYCGQFADLTGRPVVYCPGPRDEPVCDAPGERAGFEVGPDGYVLAGGRYAFCTAEGEVACPAGTGGDPYCITDPEL